MKYRGRTEIVATILDTANEGAIKTKIMYTAFLGYNQLKEIPFCFERKQSNRI
jgi:predicted transcriptional regulator